MFYVKYKKIDKLDKYTDNLNECIFYVHRLWKVKISMLR